MNWLMVLLLFDVSNGLEQKMHTEKVFENEKSCQSEGLRLTQNVQYENGLKASFVCVELPKPEEPKRKKRWPL